MLCNTQSELHPLEEGKHAAESGMDLKAYAAASGKGYENLRVKSKAWRVLADSVHAYATGFEGTPEQQTEYLGKLVDTAHDSWRNLAEIHAAPPWLWGALVEKMTSEARLVAALGWNNVPPAELSKGLAGETLLLTTTPSNMPGSILVPYGARFG